MDAALLRTRTLCMLAAAFAVTGVMLLYPWNAGQHTKVESPQQSGPGPEGPANAVASRPSPASQPGVGRGTTPEPSGPVQTPPAIESEPWLAAATGYAGAFTARAQDHSEWVAGLEPWVTRDLAEQYARTHPARRPRGAVDSVETVTPGDYSAHVKVAYDSGLVLMVRVANGPDGWRVTYVEPIAGT